MAKVAKIWSKLNIKRFGQIVRLDFCRSTESDPSMESSLHDRLLPHENMRGTLSFEGSLQALSAFLKATSDPSLSRAA